METAVLKVVRHSVRLYKLQIVVARSHCWFVSYVSCVWHRPCVSK